MNSFLNSRHKINASALGYAIAFLLLIGLMCSGILFVSSVNKRLEINYSQKDHLLFNNQLSLQYGMNKMSYGDKLLIHSTGDTSKIRRKRWGAYDLVHVNTFHGMNSVEKTTLCGMQVENSLTTLYMPDVKGASSLKICGDTRIEGDVYLSKKGIEAGRIGQNEYSNTQLVFGRTLKSKNTLPQLSNSVFSPTLKELFHTSNQLKLPSSDTIFSFSEKTQLITQKEAVILQNALKGNCVIHSFDSIFVSASAHLENVILIAPVIRFEKGFKGAAQAMANTRITCEENVELKYPSTLTLLEIEPAENSNQNGIYLRKNCQVIGGVLLHSEKPSKKHPLLLEVNNATIGGIVYNVGQTNLKGNIAGCLYTNSFLLKVGGGQYSNYLLDVNLSREKLPANFIVPNWLKSDEVSQIKMILWI